MVRCRINSFHFLPCCQTVTEKHKLNVPETMTEVLDVSDEEGESWCQYNTQCSLEFVIK